MATCNERCHDCLVRGRIYYKKKERWILETYNCFGSEISLSFEYENWKKLEERRKRERRKDLREEGGASLF